MISMTFETAADLTASAKDMPINASIKAARAALHFVIWRLRNDPIDIPASREGFHDIVDASLTGWIL
jgi:hypothetical protein